MSQRLSKKIFHICMILVIIVIIIFVAVMFILNYEENGETNMPFNISKISIISTVSGENVEDETNKWHFNVVQNNDIYIYIEQNSEYKKQEIISSIKLDNFRMKASPNIGEAKIYKPSLNDMSLFINSEENIASDIEFVGSNASDIRNLQIANQGGALAFRCANINIGDYISNEEEEINYNELLKKLNMAEEDLTFQISFDITLSLNSGKIFKAEAIDLSLPVEGIVDQGTIGMEIENLENIVFKRIEN